MSDGQQSVKNLSEAISSTLPFLRRYARAVTGSQKQGDEWVRLCAEVILRQHEVVGDAPNTKLGVFALFHRLQQPFGGLDAAGEAVSVSGRLKESLTEMAPQQRQVLLLTVLEGFTVVDAAHILAGSPQAMQLRYLNTLFDIASERSSLIVFPFPIELMQVFSAMRPENRSG